MLVLALESVSWWRVHTSLTSKKEKIDCSLGINLKNDVDCLVYFFKKTFLLLEMFIILIAIDSQHS